MAKQKRQITWVEVAIKHGGLRKATKALTWAYTWAVVREANGQDPTVEQVAAWWKESERNAYREKAAFHACFPMFDTPAPLFATDEAREPLRKLVQIGDHIEATKKDRDLTPDAAFLSLGLLPASPEALA